MAGLSVNPENSAARSRRKSMDPVSEFIHLQELPNPGNRFQIQELLGKGTSASVYAALDQQKSMRVAIKIIRNIAENILEIEAEYRTLCSIGGQNLLPVFHGAYIHNKDDGQKELWFVMELCEGVVVSTLLKYAMKQNRSFKEEEISVLLKAMLIVIHHLHENDIVHRDIRASNFILSSSGDVKIIDFGFSAILKGENVKSHSDVGAPHWMAPEVIVSEQTTSYSKSCDIWSLGITAIELAEKNPPLFEVHPVRALFQIARNPPPTLKKSEEYSDVFKDFIEECLVKNPDYRPCAAELLLHPFITRPDDLKKEVSLQEMVSQGIVPSLTVKNKKILESLGELVLEYSSELHDIEPPYVTFKNWHLKSGPESSFTRVLPDDMACIEQISKENVLDLLEQRFLKSEVFTFVGDFLLYAHSKDKRIDYEVKGGWKYCEKARSDNSPHIFAVADRAYQQMLHHRRPQVVLMTGQCNSGKSVLTSEVIKHLAFLGPANKINKGFQHMYEITRTLKKSFDVAEKILHICPLLDAFGNAHISSNPNASRYMKTITVTFTKTGKISGAVINSKLMENFRFSSLFINHSNFHVFYYVFEGMKSAGKLSEYGLDNLRTFRYLPGLEANRNKENDLKTYNTIIAAFKNLNYKQEEISSVIHTLSALLILGDIEYKVKGKSVEPASTKLVESAANNLGVNKSTLLSFLSKAKDVKDARTRTDTLALLLYEGLFNWIVSSLNNMLSFSRLVLGDKYSVSVVDLPGYGRADSGNFFDLSSKILNDLVHIRIQRLVFVKELEDYQEQKLDVPFKYEDCSIQSQELDEQEEKITKLMDALQKVVSSGSSRWTKELDNCMRSSNIDVDKNNITIKHLFNQVQYKKDAILPKCKFYSEFISTLKTSNNPVVASFWQEPPEEKPWHHQHILSYLDDQNDFPHVVVCLNVDASPTEGGGFDKDQILSQIQSLNLVETATIRKQGYARQLLFQDFLNRYKYLGFGFDENVDVTVDNCRLLLLRLKMDGWKIGPNKVFLKYYAEEYLSRLYETHVKKIIKVQAMARRFIVNTRRSKKT